MVLMLVQIMTLVKVYMMLVKDQMKYDLLLMDLLMGLYKELMMGLKMVQRIFFS